MSMFMHVYKCLFHGIKCEDMAMVKLEQIQGCPDIPIGCECIVMEL